MHKVLDAIFQCSVVRDLSFPEIKYNYTSN
jgi:hypothetical protein